MIHVLIVDDDDHVRRALGRTLRRDHTITESASTEDAKLVLLSEDCTVDVIVSDLMMPPGGTGLDLYVWVKKNRPSLADRFMICSGGGPQGLRDGVTRQGIPFLAKPAAGREIRDAVQRLVSKSEPRGPADPT